MNTHDRFRSFYDRSTVVVTGGAGFIGSHLVRGLAGLGASVRIIDDLSEGTLANLEGLGGDIDFNQASILDQDALQKVMAGASVVFHEAALASVPGSIAEPQRYHDVNVTGTLRVLETARAENLRRVVFASSSSVYGDLPQLPKREDHLPDPMSPYAQQKLTAEHMLRVWSLSYGLSTVSLRYFNIFGPGQRADSAYAAVVAAFANALLDGKPGRIFGDGSASRDFTYIDNVVQANLCAGMVGLEDKATDEERTAPACQGGAFNIGCGLRVTVLELHQAMAAEASLDAGPILEPERPGDVLHSLADISRARQALGYEPAVDLVAGLKPTMQWYRSQRETAAT